MHRAEPVGQDDEEEGHGDAVAEPPLGVVGELYPGELIRLARLSQDTDFSFILLWSKPSNGPSNLQNSEFKKPPLSNYY